jgi:hypothetical protein
MIRRHEVTCQARPHIDTRVIGWQYDRRSHLTGLNAHCDVDTVNIEVGCRGGYRVDGLLLVLALGILAPTDDTHRFAAPHYIHLAQASKHQR